MLRNRIVRKFMLNDAEVTKYMRSQVYFFVDDQKGNTKAPENSQHIWIRSFDEIDGQEFQGLIRFLKKKEAWNWHAKSLKGLPQSSDFLKILRKINRCNSKLYHFCRTEEQLDSPEFADAIRDFHTLCKNDEWAKHWDFKNRQAALLLWSIVSTIYTHWRGYPQRCDAPPEMLTFMTDRMDFFDEKTLNKELKKKNPLPEGCVPILYFETKMGFGVRILGIQSKKNADKEVLSMLSIPDGEAWIWNRFISFQTADGRSIMNSGVEYSKMDRVNQGVFQFPLKEVLSSLETSDFSRASFKKLHRKILQYTNFWNMWLDEGRATMNGFYIAEINDRTKKATYPPWFNRSEV